MIELIIYGAIAHGVLLGGLVWSEFKKSYIFDDEMVNAAVFLIVGFFWPVSVVFGLIGFVVALLVKLAKWIAKEGRRL